MIDYSKIQQDASNTWDEILRPLYPSYKKGVSPVVAPPSTWGDILQPLYPSYKMEELTQDTAQSIPLSKDFSDFKVTLGDYKTKRSLDTLAPEMWTDTDRAVDSAYKELLRREDEEKGIKPPPKEGGYTGIAKGIMGAVQPGLDILKPAGDLLGTVVKPLMDAFEWEQNKWEGVLGLGTAAVKEALEIPEEIQRGTGITSDEIERAIIDPKKYWDEEATLPVVGNTFWKGWFELVFNPINFIPVGGAFKWLGTASRTLSRVSKPYAQLAEMMGEIGVKGDAAWNRLPVIPNLFKESVRTQANKATDTIKEHGKYLFDGLDPSDASQAAERVSAYVKNPQEIPEEIMISDFLSPRADILRTRIGEAAKENKNFYNDLAKSVQTFKIENGKRVDFTRDAMLPDVIGRLEEAVTGAFKITPMTTGQKFLSGMKQIISLPLLTLRPAFYFYNTLGNTANAALFKVFPTLETVASIDARVTAAGWSDVVSKRILVGIQEELAGLGYQQASLWRKMPIIGKPAEWLQQKGISLNNYIEKYFGIRIFEVKSSEALREGIGELLKKYPDIHPAFRRELLGVTNPKNLYGFFDNLSHKRELVTTLANLPIKQEGLRQWAEGGSYPDEIKGILDKIKTASPLEIGKTIDEGYDGLRQWRAQEEKYIRGLKQNTVPEPVKTELPHKDLSDWLERGKVNLPGEYNTIFKAINEYHINPQSFIPFTKKRVGLNTLEPVWDYLQRPEILGVDRLNAFFAQIPDIKNATTGHQKLDSLRRAYLSLPQYEGINQATLFALSAWRKGEPLAGIPGPIKTYLQKLGYDPRQYTNEEIMNLAEYLAITRGEVRYPDIFKGTKAKLSDEEYLGLIYRPSPAQIEKLKGLINDPFIGKLEPQDLAKLENQLETLKQKGYLATEDYEAFSQKIQEAKKPPEIPPEEPPTLKPPPSGPEAPVGAAEETAEGLAQLEGEKAALIKEGKHYEASKVSDKITRLKAPEKTLEQQLTDLKRGLAELETPEELSTIKQEIAQQVKIPTEVRAQAEIPARESPSVWLEKLGKVLPQGSRVTYPKPITVEYEFPNWSEAQIVDFRANKVETEAIAKYEELYNHWWQGYYIDKNDPIYQKIIAHYRNAFKDLPGFEEMQVITQDSLADIREVLDSVEGLYKALGITLTPKFSYEPSAITSLIGKIKDASPKFVHSREQIQAGLTDTLPLKDYWGGELISLEDAAAQGRLREPLKVLNNAILRGMQIRYLQNLLKENPSRIARGLKEGLRYRPAEEFTPGLVGPKERRAMLYDVEQAMTNRATPPLEAEPKLRGMIAEFNKIIDTLETRLGILEGYTGTPTESFNIGGTKELLVRARSSLQQAQVELRKVISTKTPEHAFNMLRTVEEYEEQSKRLYLAEKLLEKSLPIREMPLDNIGYMLASSENPSEVLNQARIALRVKGGEVEVAATEYLKASADEITRSMSKFTLDDRLGFLKEFTEADLSEAAVKTMYIYPLLHSGEEITALTIRTLERPEFTLRWAAVYDIAANRGWVTPINYTSPLDGNIATVFGDTELSRKLRQVLPAIFPKGNVFPRLDRLVTLQEEREPLSAILETYLDPTEEGFQSKLGTILETQYQGLGIGELPSYLRKKWETRFSELVSNNQELVAALRKDHPKLADGDLVNWRLVKTYDERLYNELFRQAIEDITTRDIILKEYDILRKTHTGMTPGEILALAEGNLGLTMPVGKGMGIPSKPRGADPLNELAEIIRGNANDPGYTPSLRALLRELGMGTGSTSEEMITYTALYNTLANKELTIRDLYGRIGKNITSEGALRKLRIDTEQLRDVWPTLRIQETREQIKEIDLALVEYKKLGAKKDIKEQLNVLEKAKSELEQKLVGYEAPLDEMFQRNKVTIKKLQGEQAKLEESLANLKAEYMAADEEFAFQAGEYDTTLLELERSKNTVSLLRGRITEGNKKLTTVTKTNEAFRLIAEHDIKASIESYNQKLADELAHRQAIQTEFTEIREILDNLKASTGYTNKEKGINELLKPIRYELSRAKTYNRRLEREMDEEITAAISAEFSKILDKPITLDKLDQLKIDTRLISYEPWLEDARKTLHSAINYLSKNTEAILGKYSTPKTIARKIEELKSNIIRLDQSLQRITPMEGAAPLGKERLFKTHLGRNMQENVDEVLYPFSQKRMLYKRKAPPLNTPDNASYLTDADQAEAVMNIHYDNAQQMLKLYKDVADNPASYRIPGLDEASQAMITKYTTDPLLKRSLRDMVFEAEMKGLSARDAIIFNYASRMNMDDMLNYIFPYHFWYTREANLVARYLAHYPGRFHTFQQIVEDWEESNKGMPSRLKHTLPTPLEGVRADPFRAITPFAQPFPQAMEENEDITPLGRIWKMSGMQPWPGFMEMAAALGFIGNVEEMARDILPQTGMARGVFGPDIREPWMAMFYGTKKFPAEDYLIKRKLAEWATEGKVTSPEAERASIEGTGELWEKARQGANKEQGIAAWVRNLFAVSPKFYSKGEKKYYDELAPALKSAKSKAEYNAIIEQHPELVVWFARSTDEENLVVKKDTFHYFDENKVLADKYSTKRKSYAPWEDKYKDLKVEEYREREKLRVKYPKADVTPSLRTMNLPELKQSIRDTELRELSDKFFLATKDKDYDAAEEIIADNPDLDTYWKRNDTPLEAAWRTRQKDFRAAWDTLNPLAETADNLPQGSKQRSAAWKVYYAQRGVVEEELDRIKATDLIEEIMGEYPGRWSQEELQKELKGKWIPGFGEEYPTKTTSYPTGGTARGTRTVKIVPKEAQPYAETATRGSAVPRGRITAPSRPATKVVPPPKLVSPPARLTSPPARLAAPAKKPQNLVMPPPPTMIRP